MYGKLAIATLNSITRETTLAAIAESDGIGQESCYIGAASTAPASTSWPKRKSHDSKSIVGVAHGLQPGKTVLTASEFSDADRQ
jgi:hypothetical protein